MVNSLGKSSLARMAVPIIIYYLCIRILKNLNYGNKGILRKRDAGTKTKMVKVVACAIISEDV